MLRQIIVLKKNDILYRRYFGNALNNSEIEDLSFKIWSTVKKRIDKKTDHFDYFKYRISYDVDLDSGLIFIFITGLVDDYFRVIKPHLSGFKKLFSDMINIEKSKIELSLIEIEHLNSIADPLHKKLKPKIAVVGFSGVGKTTIKKLIKLDEIPLQHVPTITGDIATIKLGKLFFNLFDFAGQDEFKFMWKSFIKGSDAVLLITDSTPYNINKSKFFIDLMEKEVPYARSAVIGNKQDLKEAMDIKEIEKELGLITYPMIANRAENRERMIQILAEILDLSIEATPIIGSLMDKSPLLEETIKIKQVQKVEESGTNISSEISRESPLQLEIQPELQIEQPNENVDIHFTTKKQELMKEIEDVNIKDRLLGIIRAKKKVKIDYIERFLKTTPDKIVGLIFELIGSSEIIGEFNEDDSEFTLKI